MMSFMLERKPGFFFQWKIKPALVSWLFFGLLVLIYVISYLEFLKLTKIARMVQTFTN